MSKTRVLVDLKPALDGFAGIPQESRLLFNNLLQLTDDLDVDGLLQHGTGLLIANTVSAYRAKSPNERHVWDSEFLANLRMGLEKSYLPRVPVWIQKRIYNQEIRWQAFTGKPLVMGELQTDRFKDLIWDLLFSKALNRADMNRVTEARFRMLEPSRQHMYNIMLGGVRLFPAKQYPKIDSTDYDIFIAQSPFPGRVSANSKLVIRYHDAVPIFMPHTIADRAAHSNMHYRALQSNLKDGAYFACVSEASRQDLLSLFPQAEERAHVIHNTVLSSFSPKESNESQAWDIIHSRLSGEHVRQAPRARDTERTPPYILMVSTLEPRKNHKLLFSAWEQLRQRSGCKPKLVLVGSKGWDFEPILSHMRPWIDQGEMYHLQNIPTPDLCILYQHAAITVCPSISEGFDYSGAEAMACRGIVAASDIPVHREVLGDAAVYFDPYSTDDTAKKLNELLHETSATRVEAMRDMGQTRSKRYSDKMLRPKWLEFIQSIANQPSR